jgi:hypothetical protein
MIKKTFIILILALVFLFNTIGSFSFSHDNLHEKENILLVYPSNKSGNTFFETSNDETDDTGVAEKKPMSKSSFAILVSSLILMLLFRTKDIQ